MISAPELMDWLRAEPEDLELILSLEAAAVEVINQGGRYFGPEREIVEDVPFQGGVIQLQSDPVGAVAVGQLAGGAWDSVALDGYHVAGRLLYLHHTPTRFGSAWVRVTYRAGYPQAEDSDPNVWDAPEPIKQAVRMLVGHWYANREAAVVGTTSSTVQFGLDMILAAYR